MYNLHQNKIYHKLLRQKPKIRLKVQFLFNIIVH